MAANYLRKSEIEYELMIRGQSYQGPVDELRKRLSQCFSNNVEVVADIVQELQVSSELETCEEKYNDLLEQVEDSDKNSKTREGQRLLARLRHLQSRIQRLNIDAEDDLASRRDCLFNEVGSLLTSFRTSDGDRTKMRVNVMDGPSDMEQPLVTTPLIQIEEPTGASQNPFNDVPQPIQHLPSLTATLRTGDPGQRSPVTAMADVHERIDHGRSIPVFKWGLKFDNSPGQSIGGFLQRVEELRRARRVTTSELFQTSVDLFDGPALVWYRSTIGRIFSWEELREEMKIVFQPPDHDIRLQQEIFNRVQGDNEPIDMFIAAMEALYGRLASSVSEDCRLRQMFHNLNPQLQDRLALFDVRTVEQLRELGRKAELGRFRSATPRHVTSNIGVLEPDLAYHGIPRRRTSQIASLQTTSSRVNTSAKCWNCDSKEHKFRFCQQERKKFCFGCGAPNVFKSQCSKCHPKNG